MVWMILSHVRELEVLSVVIITSVWPSAATTAATTAAAASTFAMPTAPGVLAAAEWVWSVAHSWRVACSIGCVACTGSSVSCGRQIRCCLRFGTGA